MRLLRPSHPSQQDVQELPETRSPPWCLQLLCRELYLGSVGCKSCSVCARASPCITIHKQDVFLCTGTRITSPAVYFGVSNHVSSRLSISSNLYACKENTARWLHLEGYSVQNTMWGRRSLQTQRPALRSNLHVENMLRLRGLFTCRMRHWRKSGRGVASW
jgi:hypothetical protein